MRYEINIPDEALTPERQRRLADFLERLGRDPALLDGDIQPRPSVPFEKVWGMFAADDALMQQIAGDIQQARARETWRSS